MHDGPVAKRLMDYTAWADDVMLKNAEALSPEIITAKRDTLFDSIAETFDHILVVGEIFRAHLCGLPHAHKARRRAETLPFSEIADRLRAMDTFYVNFAKSLTNYDLKQVVSFKFVDGGDGAMSREDILVHLANHATYHRGFISTLIFPFAPNIAASDFTVFMRDAWPNQTNLRR